MKRPVLSLVALAVLAAGCSGGPGTPDPARVTASMLPTEASSPAARATPTPSPTTPPSPTADSSPGPTATGGEPGTVDGLGPVDDLADGELAELAVNEIGRVMVSEWHEVGTDTDGDYQTTTATFRSQLQELYDRGYRPVTTREYRDATFPIPLGTRPVVLTFDDASPNHFRWAEDGETPDPGSVVGILEEFAADHEDWRTTAVFAYNWPPFGTTDDDSIAAKLQWLVDHGYELSNHTLTHPNLADLAPQEVQDEIGGNLANATDLVPGATIDTLTLPFGAHPVDDELAVSGTSSSGAGYHNELVFEVGWMPDSSPNHVEYDPTSIMRVPAHGPWADDAVDWWGWLDWLDGDGHAFVSDGDPDTVTFPVGFTEVADVAEDSPTRIYEAATAGASESDDG